MVALVIRDGRAREGTKQTVHFAVIISLLLQCRLHIGNHLIGRQVVIPVDRPVISVIRIGSITPCWEPEARVPIIPSAIYENYAVIMAPPPTLVVPLRRIIPENRISLALPVLASLDASALLEIDGCNFCRSSLRWQIELLRLERLARCRCRCLAGCRGLSGCCRR